MCRAFSCVITKDKKVYWELGIDNHHTLVEKHNLQDSTNYLNMMKIARVEITPNNRNYISPDEWVIHIDERITPEWFSPAHEQCCFDAHKTWLEQLDKILVKKLIINPFRDVNPPKKITKQHIQLLKQWDSVRASVGDSVRASVWDSVWDSVGDSVRDSVGDSVWDSVWDSVRASVGDSVGASVWDSVWDSVRDSVRAYISSFFNLERNQWKYTEGVKCNTNNPFQPCIDLWEMGLVSSFDGKMWRLHGGKKLKKLFKISEYDLKKY